MSVLVVGEALVDVVARHGEPEVRRAGGSPFNVAIGLARLGVPTSLAAQFGRDADSEMLRLALADSGVEVDELAPASARTATAAATIAADGSASYEFDIVWNPTTLPDPSAFEAVHVGSIAASLAPGADRVAELVDAAAASGIPVTFDPNIRLAIQDDLAELRRRFDAIASLATLVKMSDEDAAALFPGIPLDGLAAGLASAGAIVAITRGGKGAILCAGGEAAYVSSPLIAVVDTIGAGDSFMAALVAGLVELSWPDRFGVDDLQHLGELASGSAAITCKREGADPPRRPEVDGLFAALRP